MTSTSFMRTADDWTEEITGSKLRYISLQEDLRQLQPGQHLTYHIGDLANDRVADKELSELALVAWSLANAGKIFLVKKRLTIGAKSEFAYIAIGR